LGHYSTADAMMDVEAGIIGMAATALAAGAFMLLECCGVRWSPKWQWFVGIALIIIFLWFLWILIDAGSGLTKSR
jgi:hypothetical protein